MYSLSLSLSSVPLFCTVGLKWIKSFECPVIKNKVEMHERLQLQSAWSQAGQDVQVNKRLATWSICGFTMLLNSECLLYRQDALEAFCIASSFPGHHKALFLSSNSSIRALARRTHCNDLSCRKQSTVLACHNLTIILRLHNGAWASTTHFIVIIGLFL